MKCIYNFTINALMRNQNIQNLYITNPTFSKANIHDIQANISVTKNCGET